MPNELSLIFEALDFAAKKHRDQRRKDINATPYINHPIELAELLVNEGAVDDVSVLVAAILHDTVEDTETTIEELESMFGMEIANVVAEVTDDKTMPKNERKQLQIDHASSSSAKAKLVKLADKICNLRDLEMHPPADWSLQRIREYYDWAKLVIDQLRGIHVELEEIFDRHYANKP